MARRSSKYLMPSAAAEVMTQLALHQGRRRSPLMPKCSSSQGKGLRRRGQGHQRLGLLGRTLVDGGFQPRSRVLGLAGSPGRYASIRRPCRVYYLQCMARTKWVIAGDTLEGGRGEVEGRLRRPALTVASIPIPTRLEFMLSKKGLSVPCQWTLASACHADHRVRPTGHRTWGAGFKGSPIVRSPFTFRPYEPVTIADFHGVPLVRRFARSKVNAAAS